MISANYVVGQFDKITTEQIIPIPGAKKIILTVDNGIVLVSINNNTNYMKYKNADGVIELYLDFINTSKVTSVYIKSADGVTPCQARIWAVI
jgi:hypothetical protein